MAFIAGSLSCVDAVLVAGAASHLPADFRVKTERRQRETIVVSVCARPRTLLTMRCRTEKAISECTGSAFQVPAQRVAVILHDVFRYSFAEVAEITGRTPAACRQLASSARRRIRASQAPATPAARQAGIIRDFKKAWEARDIDALIGLLDPGATVIADGGGLVPAALRPIEGGEQIARYLADIAGRAPSLTILERTVNGQPGLVAQQDGVTVTVFAFDVAGGRITHIWAVRNPDKLRPWTTG